jgi:glycolate oxidase FAD binding subunit
MAETFTIDAVGPMPVERPSTVAELCAIVRRCADTKTAIYPVGGGTMLDFGMPPARPGIALSTTALSQIIDYPARDLTITVQAGITVKELQATLAKENQWLPIDIPETATIGGAIACDVSGPRRYGYGTLRDYVIGITVVNDRGEETHAGGRVVKNVAGYDFMKLHTGALGTLGVITQVTLKVKPKPEVRRCFFTGHSDGDFSDALGIMARTKTTPASITAMNHPGPHWREGRRDTKWHWHTIIGFDGTEDAVTWQADQLRLELHDSQPEFAGPGDPHGVWVPEGERVCCFQTRVYDALVAQLCRVLGALDSNLRVWGSPGVGGIRVSLTDQKRWPLSRVQQTLERLQRDFGDSGGGFIIEHCPTEWKKSLNIWGRPPADLALQKAVKRALDPQNLFNPGRFVTDAF